MKDFDARDCGRNPSDKDCYVKDLDLTPSEEAVLKISRYYFQSFACPESHAWIRAMIEAEDRFGYENGPRVAARTLAALQAVRNARQSDFIFNAPDCPGCALIATEQERRMMLSLAAIRRGDVGRARMEIMMLCEGTGVSYVLSAMGAVSRVLRDVGPGKMSAPVLTRVLQ